jgi:hypothetical protein
MPTSCSNWRTLLETESERLREVRGLGLGLRKSSGCTVGGRCRLRLRMRRRNALRVQHGKPALELPAGRPKL